jgi:predicted glutamine amidotransferase
MQHADRRALCHIVSSEPLTTDTGDWIEVPQNYIITINERNNLLIEPVVM